MIQRSSCNLEHLTIRHESYLADVIDCLTLSPSLQQLIINCNYVEQPSSSFPMIISILDRLAETSTANGQPEFVLCPNLLKLQIELYDHFKPPLVSLTNFIVSRCCVGTQGTSRTSYLQELEWVSSRIWYSGDDGYFALSKEWATFTKDNLAFQECTREGLPMNVSISFGPYEHCYGPGFPRCILHKWYIRC